MSRAEADRRDRNYNDSRSSRHHENPSRNSSRNSSLSIGSKYTSANSPIPSTSRINGEKRPPSSLRPESSSRRKRPQSSEAIDMIELSSGSERPDSVSRDAPSVKRLESYKSKAEISARKTKKKATPGDKKEKMQKTNDSDASLSEGEIRSYSPGSRGSASRDDDNGKYSAVKKEREVVASARKEKSSDSGIQADIVEKPPIKKSKKKRSSSKKKIAPEKLVENFFEDEIGSVSTKATSEEKTVMEEDDDLQSGEQAPLIEVKFLNSFIANKYNHVFQTLIKGILVKERKNMAALRATAARTDEVPVSITYHDHFEVDTLATEPSTEEDVKPSKQRNLFGLGDISIPDLQTEIVEQKNEGKAENTTPKTTVRQKECFNCGGNHTLMECTEPRDFARINAKRREFLDSNSHSSSSRYHEQGADSEDIIKHGEFPDVVPGQISDKLQIALGLDRRDVPPWIFRMRECGYPPGWIRSCVVESCGLTFFNEDDAQEDSASDVKYDLSKLPSFPGFSAPHSRDILQTPLVRIRRDMPFPHQSDEAVTRFLKQLAVRQVIEARSPSPEVNASRPEEMDLSDGEGAEIKLVEPTTPDWPSPSNNEETVEEKISRTVIQTEERFELIETSSSAIAASPVTRKEAAALLKTSSVPDLGSFSGLNVLPDNSRFAEGVTSWPFEEETVSTGRYANIKNALSASKGKKK